MVGHRTYKSFICDTILEKIIFEHNNTIRKHSSRMCTAHLLTITHSIRPILNRMTYTGENITLAQT